MTDRKDQIEETENREQRHSRERAREVEQAEKRKSRGAPARKDLDPSPNQRTVQPSDRTRRSE